MNKKIICILVTSMFLLTGVMSVSAIYVENSRNIEELGSLTYGEVFREKTFEKQEILEDFDMFIDAIAWWSPNPYSEDTEFICFNLIIDYVGIYDTTNDYNVTIRVYNGESLLDQLDYVFGTFWNPKLIWLRSQPGTEKPFSLKFEFETDYPGEIILDNNQKTVSVDMGITVEGYVKERTPEGELIPIYSTVRCLADDSHFVEYYFSTRSIPSEDGHYSVYAPCVSGYEYPIKNYYDVTMTKYITSWEEFQTYRLDFIFNDLPPYEPSIDGPSSGNAGEAYDYTFSAVDPDGDDVYLWIQWGDGTVEQDGWIGPYESGEEVTISHTWSEQGAYTISAKAKDICGVESEWATLHVTMPLDLKSSQQSSPTPQTQPVTQPSSQPSSQLITPPGSIQQFLTSSTTPFSKITSR